jgi:hypothetical protein
MSWDSDQSERPNIEGERLPPITRSAKKPTTKLNPPTLPLLYSNHPSFIHEYILPCSPRPHRDIPKSAPLYKQDLLFHDIDKEWSAITWDPTLVELFMKQDL